MKCPHCKQEMKGFWCDDDIHTPGMLYECKCGKKYFEEEGQTLKLIATERLHESHIIGKETLLKLKEKASVFSDNIDDWIETDDDKMINSFIKDIGNLIFNYYKTTRTKR